MTIYEHIYPIMNNHSTKLFKVNHFAQIFFWEIFMGAIAFFSYQLSAFIPKQS
ncbi:MAG: hypothetical protein F6K48_11455 [Okeania sp. SIO3H1]|nr:hypothetical protein [Okeania sp. SIO3H1]